MTATTSTTDRPGLEELCTVFFDRQFSTTWAELYRAASDTVAGRVYEVKFYPESRAWTCQCVGFTRHGHCRHQRRADRLRRIRFFSALFGGQPPHILRAHLRHYQERAEAGYANEDDLCAIDFLTMRLDGEKAA